jgi:hypothetical protein
MGNRLKKSLITITDQFLHFLLEQPFAPSLLGKSKFESYHQLSIDGLIDCIVNFANRPVARKQTFEHFFDWLRSQISDNENCARNLGLIDNNFSRVQQLVVTGITDVWSAIRKTCMSGLEWTSTEFTIHQLEALLADFTKVKLFSRAKIKLMKHRLHSTIQLRGL